MSWALSEYRNGTTAAHPEGEISDEDMDTSAEDGEVDEGEIDDEQLAADHDAQPTLLQASATTTTMGVNPKLPSLASMPHSLIALGKRPANLKCPTTKN